MQSARGAAALWNNERHVTIARALEPDLRWPERAAARRVSTAAQPQVQLGHLVLSRLLARRPSRMGWRAPLRRIWAHPGIIESETPVEWSWARRRVAHLVARLRSARW